MQPKMTKISLIILLFFFTACHPLHCEWNSGYNPVKVQPNKEDLIGEYVLTKKSQKSPIKNIKLCAFKIELLENGRYKFSSKTNQTLNEGNWLIQCLDECLLELEGISVEPLYEKDQEFAILITIGDGDDCEGIVYEKR